LPFRKCIYCDRIVEKNDGYLSHLSECSASNEVVTATVPNEQFSIVVPERSGYVWLGKTGGFACRTVAIQGVLIPLGTLRTLSLDTEAPNLDGHFESFADPQKARETYLQGVRQSTNHEYGGYDLGAKLVAETLDGVYTRDSDEKRKKRQTRDDHIQAVWTQIDEELPFTYERVAAPPGYPVTQEGLRWLNVTGHTSDDVLFREQWVDALIDSEGPVALYYPNSD
jgi:hypothetical protein